MTKKDKPLPPLPDVLPWEQTQDKKHWNKIGILLFVVLAFGIGIGFNIGIQGHDPPVTTTVTNHTNSTTGVPGINGNKGNTTLIAPSSNVSGIVILKSTVITSSSDMELYFYNSTAGGNPVITQRAQLKPVWNPVSGWITEYWLWLPPGTWNVTSNVCQPMKLITVTVSSSGVSWGVMGYPGYTSRFTADAQRTELDAECGIM